MTSLEQQENGPDKAQGTDTTSAEAVGDSVATHRMEGIGSIIKTRLEDLWVDAKVKEFIPLKILNFLLFGGMMALFPFLTLQARSLGITESELGIMYGFMPITALFGPPIAGMVADKIGNFKYFLAVMVFASGFTSLLYIPVPAGRLTVTMPEILTMSLSCSQPDMPTVTLLNSNLTCLRSNISDNTQVYVSWCQPKCLRAGPEISLSKDINQRRQSSLTNEPNTTEALQNIFKSGQVTAMLKTDTFNVPSSAFVSTKENTTTQMTFDEDICVNLNKNTHKWFLENDISSSGLQCHMECRLLADTKDTCSNEESTYDVDPTFTFWVYLVVRILNSLTLAITMPLVEGAIVSILKQYNGDFGFQRIYGSLGPLIMTPLSGLLIDTFSGYSGSQDYRPAIYLYFVVKMLCALVILTMNLEFKKPSDQVLKDFKSIVTTPEICCFLLMCFIAGSCFGAMDTFLFWLLQDIGANKSLMGLTFTVGAVCSLPILLVASPIIEKLGCVNTIILGFSFYVIRFIGYSLIYNPWLCMPFEALECFTVALLVTAAVTYAAEVSSSTTTATVQGLMGGLHHGVGRGAGSMMGGFLITSIGVRPMFQVMAAIALVSAAGYFTINRIFFRKASKERKLKREMQVKENALQMIQTVSEVTDSSVADGTVVKRRLPNALTA